MKKIIFFILNPRLLLCLGVAWIITNGWAYIAIGLGNYLDIGWMTAIAAAYLAFLWIPTTPEKIVTIAIAIALLRILFPKDQKTLAVLKGMHEKAKSLLLAKRNKRKNKKKNKEAKQGNQETAEVTGCSDNSCTPDKSDTFNNSEEH